MIEGKSPRHVMKRELEESEASGQRAELDPGLREAGGWLEDGWRMAGGRLEMAGVCPACA